MLPSAGGVVGLLERAYRTLRQAAASFGDAALEVGRDPTVAKLEGRIEGWQREIELNRYIGPMLEEKQQQIERTRQQIADLLRPKVILVDPKEIGGVIGPQAPTLVSAEERAAQSLREEWGRINDSNLSKQAQRQREINHIRETGLKLGLSEVEIQKQINAVNARFAEQDARKRGRQAPGESIISQLERQILLNREQLEVEDSLTASERLRIKALHEIDNLGGKITAGRRMMTESLIEEMITIDQLVQKQKEEIKAKEQLDRLTAQLAVTEANQARANQLDLMRYGRADSVIDSLRRRLDIERKYEDGLRQIRDNGVAESSESYRQQEAELRASRDRMLAEEKECQMQRIALMGDWKLGAFAAYEDYITKSMEIADQTKGQFVSAFQSIEDAIVQFTTTGKFSFSDMLADMSKELTRFFAKQAVAKFLSMFSGSFSGLLSGGMEKSFTKNALGGVYASPSLSSYSGGVFDTPQLFTFARGAGVFGEAGPEAIMPLRRGPDGRLGVAATGAMGGVTFNQTIVINSDQTATSQTTASDQSEAVRRFADMMRDIARDETLKAIRPGGVLYNQFGSKR